jgi:formamidopyrimidine-DNA glycosylase
MKPACGGALVRATVPAPPPFDLTIGCLMPELPEVETIRRGLQSVMEAERIAQVEVRCADLRFSLQEDFAARLEGQTIDGLGRRAKSLLVDLSSGDVLLIHLGMSGSFRIETHATADRAGGHSHEARIHDHIVFHMASGAIVLFNDPRRSGYMKIVPRAQLGREPLLSMLAPEPLGSAFSPALLAAACAGKKFSLKATLLFPHVVAGLGNIYACEALHRAHLSPKRQASTLALRGGAPAPYTKDLVDSIQAVLREGIVAGAASLRDAQKASRELGHFQHSFRIYDREGERCPTEGCDGTVERFVQHGCSTFWCRTCQK